MEFTFLKNDKVAFFRSDAEQAEWTQEELSLLCSFPYDKDKKIERGMVVLFCDPVTNSWQAYEIRNCKYYETEGYQQFTAESIAISELTDCHIAGDIEITDKRARTVLSSVLDGTGWSVGTSEVNGTSSCDIGRGSVWQAVCEIQKNWNIYIMPRVTVGTSGITGRYLDITSTEGAWRGVRLSVNKNLSDPCIEYDDSELYTALYGYGASYSEGEGESRETKETNFSSIVWSKTSEHPKKPKNQLYLEYPEKTALYGRNGKARFGYYQNTSIDDPETLLEKTWETLKKSCDPKINISGTAFDLKRFGYADEPLRLHDLAIIELDNGEIFYKQIIQLTVNLLDESKNPVVIGDYIPNIIYINRRTDEDASGGGRGAGGGTRSKKEKGEFETTIQQNERDIILNAKQVNEAGDILRQAGMEIDPITGVLIYAEDNENNIASKLKVQSDRISLVVEGEGADAKIKRGSIILAINNGKTSAKISADEIELDGNTIAKWIQAMDITVGSLTVTNGIECKAIDSGFIDCTGINTNDEDITCGDINGGEGKFTSLKVGKARITSAGAITGASLEVTGAVSSDSLTTGSIDCTSINTNDEDITCGDVNAGAGSFSSLKAGTARISSAGAITGTSLEVTGAVSSDSINTGQVDCTGINTNDADIICGDISASGATFSSSSIKIGTHTGTWKYFTYYTYTLGTYAGFKNISGNTVNMFPVTGSQSHNIYYFGYS